MEIGRSSPRHQELALMYTRSKSLQAYISEYYIVAVEFCHEMLRFTQRSAFRQFTTTLSGNLIKKTQSEMDDWGGRIKDEMLMLIARRTEDEATENSRFRSMSKKFSKSTSYHNRLAMKLRILKECSTYDHETPWKQIRKSGNTTTFSETNDYQKWKTQSQSCTLLYYGKLGCGKSVVLSNMVDDLNLADGQHHTSVAYFFVREDLPDSLKARTIVGSLTRQLLVTKDDWTDATEAISSSLGVHEMLSLLLEFCNKQQKIYLVLDGLDLCKKEDIEVIVGFVKQLQEEMWVLTCVSLRQQPDREPDAVYRGFRTLQISSLPDNNSDIASFIDAELARCVEDSNLKLGNAALILTIRDALLAGSNGMFLWVSLQIKVLCSMETDMEIEDALADLPIDLSETYFRILGKEQGRRKVHQGRILRLITAATLPLTTDEMRDALSITPGQTDWTKRNTINDIYSTLTTCGCLIQVDEEENTVRFVHQSVKEFFLRPQLHHLANVSSEDSRDSAVVTMEDCHGTMADIIVTYLSYGVFDKRVSTSRVPIIEVGETPLMAVKAITESSQMVQNLALKLLSHRKRLDFDLGKTIAEEMAACNSRKRPEFPFLNYAKKWSFHHVLSINAMAPSSILKELFPAILDELDVESISESEPDGILSMAVKHNNKWLLELLTGVPNFSSDPLFHRQCQGLEISTELLPPPDSYAPICYIIDLGDLSMVQKYLWKNSSHYDHICSSGRNPIAFAIWRGKMHIAELLVQGGRISVNTGHPGHTPLEEALKQKNIAALRLLWSSGRLTVMKDDEKEKLIAQARANGFEEAVDFIKEPVQVASLYATARYMGSDGRVSGPWNQKEVQDSTFTSREQHYENLLESPDELGTVSESKPSRLDK
jgi:hypothetical protein